MHILLYHQYFISREGYGGTRSYENAQALINAGHTVTVVCGDGQSGLNNEYIRGKRRGNVDGIDIIQFDTKYSNHQSLFRRSMSFFMFAIRSISIVFTEKYDVIFATSTPLTIGIPGIFAKLFLRKTFIFEVRDLWPELPVAMGVIKNPLIIYAMSFLELLTYKSADRLVGLSKGMVDGIVKRGIPRNKVKLLPNGCDIELFDLSNNDVPDEIFNKGFFIAIFSGAHGVANGLDEIIDTASYLKDINEKEIKFLLIGDGKCKPDLILKTKERGLDNCIFRDPVSRNEITSYLKNSDIGLQILKNIPEFYNGTSPNKFYDYLSAGIPVLVNYPGEVAEIVEKEKSGIAVKPEDHKAFANALINLKNDSKRHNEMKKNSKKIARERFNRKFIIKDWVNWITKEV